MTAEFHLAASGSLSPLSDTAIINVITNICAFPAAS